MSMAEVTTYKNMDSGSATVKEYYDKINQEYPEWLTNTFHNLPRVVKGQLVFVVRFCFEDYNHDDSGGKVVWIINELSGKWGCEYFLKFTFEIEEEAVAFKLRWS